MTTIQEKKAMKILNYYNELSAYSKQVQYSNVQFLGIEYINDNPLLRFKLENGKHFRRQLYDNTMYYEHIPTENDDNITNEEISNIKFNEIDDNGEKKDKIN
jgi:ABC-type uncharacterized transport system substrate-binding protein